MRKSAKLILLALLAAMSITTTPSAVGVVMAMPTSDPELLVTYEEPGEAPSVESTDTSSANLNSDLKDEISAPVPQYSVTEIVQLASQAYGLNPNRMLQISWCESRHGTDTGYRFLGVFQFTPATWNDASIKAGFGIWDDVQKRFIPPNPHDPWTNIWTAAWLAKKEGLGHWPNC